ncbi:ATP-binding protein, partial [Acinetobacter baumannii]
TNCAKYAPSANVSVLLDLEPHQLALQVIDDGPGASSHETGGGMGLVGMRERIAILGGTFDAASLQPRGFRVRVALPIPQQDAN